MIQTILVIDKFNEAIDLPDAEVIVFLRNTDSDTIWRQQLGRGLRRTLNKHTVIVLDFAGNCHRVQQVVWMKNQIKMFGGKKRETFTFNNTGIHFAFESEIVDLVSILDYVGASNYETVEEAMEAVQKLKPVPKTFDEYLSAYKQDKKLPSYPPRSYCDDWERIGGWSGFVARDDSDRILPYETIEEAMLAVKKIKPEIKTFRNYHQRYRADSRLCSDPQSLYEKDWDRIDGWYGFLGNSKPIEKYASIEEAMAAVKKLVPVPKFVRDFLNVYSQDSKIPCNPNITYKADWKRIGYWPGFLGTQIEVVDLWPQKYYSVDEAMLVLQKLVPVPKNFEEYRIVCKQDVRLPSGPSQKYRNDWERIGGWDGFIGKQKAEDSSQP